MVDAVLGAVLPAAVRQDSAAAAAADSAVAVARAAADRNSRPA